MSGEISHSISPLRATLRTQLDTLAAAMAPARPPVVPGSDVFLSFVKGWSAGLSTEQALEWVLAQFAGATQATRAFYEVFARGEDAGLARLWREDGEPAARLPHSRPIVEQVRTSGQGLSTADARLCAHPPAQGGAVVVLPLKYEAEIVGVLYAERAEARALSAGETERLEGLAACAEIVLAHARLGQRLSDRLQKFEIVSEVSLAITATLQLEELLQLILLHALRLSGGDQGYILLGTREDLNCLASRDARGRPLEQLQISHSIVNRCLEENRSIVILDTGADEANQTASVMALDLKSVIAVPLLANRERIGVLYVSSNAITKTFTEQDRMLLESIATQAALTIRNAQLVMEQERQIMLLEETLEKYRRAEHAASTDALTGLNNRRYFEERVHQEIDQSRRHQRVFSVILLDVDHFKQFNDTHGHATGDEVLRILGRVLPASVRRYDVPARFGGEEFVVLLPDTNAAAAVAVAERIRLAIAAEQVVDAEGRPVRALTASLGIAEFTPEDQTLAPILERADIALYTCKAGGRNQTQVWNDELPTPEELKRRAQAAEGTATEAAHGS